MTLATEKGLREEIERLSDSIENLPDGASAMRQLGRRRDNLRIAYKRRYEEGTP